MLSAGEGEQQFLSYLCIWEVVFLMMSFCSLFPQRVTENALDFPQTAAFAGWCNPVSHCFSKCSRFCISLFRAVLPGVLNAAKKIKQVWKQEKMVTLLHKILYRKTPHWDWKNHFVSCSQAETFLLLSPFSSELPGRFWGAGEGCHVQVFLLTALNLGWCHRFLIFRHH